MDKRDNFLNKVIVVDGFSATGKTILPPILDSFKETLLPTYYEELEWLASLCSSGEISEQCLSSMIRNCCDLKIYNQLLGRQINFRLGDLSSIWNSKSKFQFLRRVFYRNDLKLYTERGSEKKILCLTITQAYKTSHIFHKSLGKRLLFVEFVRDPINMFLQNKILFNTVIYGDQRKDFTLRTFDKKTKNRIPLYFKDASFAGKPYKNQEEYIVSMFDYLLHQWEEMFNKCSIYKNFILIPMEDFLLKPYNYLDKISSFVGEDWNNSASIKNAIKKQSIPRSVLTKAKTPSIYKRYGFKNLNAKDLIQERKLYIDYLINSKNVSP